MMGWIKKGYLSRYSFGAMNDRDESSCKSLAANRRRLQFRLRSMLIVVAILAIPLSCVSLILRQAQQEQAAAVWARAMGGSVNYEEGSAVWNGEHVGWWREYLTKWIGNPVQRVSLQNTQVRDISPLAACKDLVWLQLADTNVSDLTAIQELKKIRGLGMANTAVSDLSPVAELRDLEWLHLSNTKVTDISPLAALQKLESLWLCDISVTDLSPLLELANLRTIALNGTQVTDVQVRSLEEALPNCEIFR